MKKEATSRPTSKHIVLSALALLFAAGCAPQSSIDSSSSALDHDHSEHVKQLSSDGDHVIFAPEGVSLHNEQVNYINEQKVYLNNSTSPLNAPKWATSEIKYYYNHANAPSSLTKSQVEGIIKTSMSRWSTVCGIKFTYMGETTAPFTAGKKDGINTITWGDAGGASGVTYSYWSTARNSQQMLLVESDIDMNIAQIRDAVTYEGVMNHELGHMLGLNHSDVSESIMFANPYHSVQYLLTLRNDDILGCKGLYGEPGAVTPEPSPSPSPTVVPSPSPSATPRPTVTPTPTPQPTVVPSPTPTPQPTVVPSPSPTVTPSPSPSATPRPTVTPSPSPTPMPTVTPRPSATPKPTVSPTPRNNGGWRVPWLRGWNIWRR